MIDPGIDIDTTFTLIRSGKSGRDQVLSMLYNDHALRSKIDSIVLKYGGQKSDCNTIFNNTLIQFVKTAVKNKDLDITSNLHAYLCGIAKYNWFNENKKELKHRTENLDDQFNISLDVTPESLVIDQGKITMLHKVLKGLGKNCKEVLMYWANGYTMDEIAKMVGYKSNMMARKKKYKCFKELLSFLEQNPDIKNVLR
ncbi:MAG: sigma-70 family RNA polymerase sigma factor [Bacteroidota bacterium]